MNYINLSDENIAAEHICCAISDKKCLEGYELKKQWIARELKNGFVFRKLNERAKVFIEYGPAEKAWLPIYAPNYYALGCFWVSGQHKGKGPGKALLDFVVQEAKKNKKSGIVTVVGTKKLHFLSDTKWLLKQGFSVCDTLSYGYSLLSMSFDEKKKPRFNDSVRSGECEQKKGYVAYYSNRCPFTEYHVAHELMETLKKRGKHCTIIKLTSCEDAQNAPSPATIFSLFHNGKYVTNDLSVCLDSRWDKVMTK